MADEEQPGFKVIDRRTAMAGAAQDAEAEKPPQPAESVSSGQETPALPSDRVEEGDAPAEAASQPPSGEGEASSDDEASLPDPSRLLGFVAMQMETAELLSVLIPVFDAHAWRSLGLLAVDRAGTVKVDLPAAQLAIDAVQFALGKIEAGLSEPQRREAQRRLTDLRMNYLAKMRETSAS
jgi:hypothetical protein